MNKTNEILAVFVAFALTGCGTPDALMTRPDVSVGSAWHQGQAEGSSSPTPIASDWWRSFGSPELDALMTQALDQNLDLKAGVAKVAQSRAALKISGASALPTIDATGNQSESWSKEESQASAHTSAVKAGLSVSYEVDLFGKTRAGISSARATLRETEYTQAALRLVVMGDVASGYFNTLALRERVEIADHNLKNAREILDVIKTRVAAGAASDLELSQQKSTVAGIEADRAALLLQQEKAETALAILLGEVPQTLAITGTSLKDIRVPDIQPDLPATLLTRRPDLAAAEQALIAAHADIDAARAAMFPSLTLGITGSVAASALTDPATSILTLLSGLSAPIFHGGVLQGQVEKVTAREEELLQTYRKDILVAFGEVEDALSTVRSARAQKEAQQTAAQSAQKAYDLSALRYRSGDIDYQTLLDTQQTLLSAQDRDAQARALQLSAAVDLYKVLGGGWR